MVEFSERQNIRKIEIAETQTSTDQLLRNTYQGIRESLSNRYLLKPIPRRKNAFQTLPLEGNLPFPLNKRDPVVNLTRTMPSEHPNDAEISWVDDDNTYRIVELRSGDHPTFIYEIGRVDEGGNRIQDRTVAYRDGKVHVEKFPPRLVSRESPIESLNDNENRYVRLNWKEAKQALESVTHGLSIK